RNLVTDERCFGPVSARRPLSAPQAAAGPCGYSAPGSWPGLSSSAALASCSKIRWNIARVFSAEILIMLIATANITAYAALIAHPTTRGQFTTVLVMYRP